MADVHRLPFPYVADQTRFVLEAVKGDRKGGHTLYPLLLPK